MLAKYFSLFIFLISLVFGSNAQTNPAINSHLEIKNERSMYSKVFLKGNGDHEAVLSSSPVHYKKNGVWEDINTTITSNKSGYQNESNVIQSYFPINSSGKIKLVVNSNQAIFIHSEKKLVLLNNQTGLSTSTINSGNSAANVIGNTINYSNIYAGISDVFTILNGEIKNNVVLSAPPTLLNNVSSGYFGFREIVELPKGWKITTPEATIDSLTSSSLLIIDSTGNPVFTIPEPVFFDNYGLQSDGKNTVEGKYLVSQEDNRWSITTLVPVQWLKDVDTKYPLSIDPTVVIAGTTGGWQSPNNFVDNPAFVFIGVCCGNLTHRAWIKFNISTIPTTSCVTNVELQVNVTSVAGTSAELVFINNVTGAFGPYGAINAAAYTDFGNGFYNSFTINGTGLYGYYSLGASANTLLQSQIPGGWFQVALQFSNEPSTVYKIISGTTSNLRVTYTNPPCAVLPIGLLSFDAKCDKGKVNLMWETATQKNNDYFTIERTKDGINYEIVGTVAGAGNSNQPLNYSFVDPKPLEGTSYYSLKQTDFNGHSENFELVAVSCDDVTEFAIRPNPSTGTFIINGVEQDGDIIITDVFGKIVFQAKIIGEKTEIDLGNQLNGIYFVQAISKNGLASKKIIVNK